MLHQSLDEKKRSHLLITTPAKNIAEDKKSIEIPLFDLSKISIEELNRSKEFLIEWLNNEFKRYNELKVTEESMKQTLSIEKTQKIECLKKINADIAIQNKKLKNINENIYRIEDKRTKNKDLLESLKLQDQYPMVGDEERTHYLKDLRQKAILFDKKIDEEIKTLNEETAKTNEQLQKYQSSLNEILAASTAISATIDLLTQNIEFYQNKINDTLVTLNLIHSLNLTNNPPAKLNIQKPDSAPTTTSFTIPEAETKTSGEQITRSKKSKIKKTIKTEEISRRIKTGELKEEKNIISINPPTITPTPQGEILEATQKDKKEQYAYTGKKTGHFCDHEYCFLNGPIDEAFEHGLKIYKNNKGYLFLHMNIDNQNYMLRITLNRRQQDQNRKANKQQTQHSLEGPKIISKKRKPQQQKMSQNAQPNRIILTRDDILKQIKEQASHVIEIDPKEIETVYKSIHKKTISNQYCFRGRPPTETIEGEFEIYKFGAKSFIYMHIDSRHYMLMIASAQTEQQRQWSQRRQMSKLIIPSTTKKSKVDRVPPPSDETYSLSDSRYSLFSLNVNNSNSSSDPMDSSNLSVRSDLLDPLLTSTKTSDDSRELDEFSELTSILTNSDEQTLVQMLIKEKEHPHSFHSRP